MTKAFCHPTALSTNVLIMLGGCSSNLPSNNVITSFLLLWKDASFMTDSSLEEKGLDFSSQFQVKMHYRRKSRQEPQINQSHPQPRAERNKNMHIQISATFLHFYTVQSPRPRNDAAHFQAASSLTATRPIPIDDKPAIKPSRHNSRGVQEANLLILEGKVA